ncbi:DUF3786 domain-containing protein [Blautia stercoris]|uniref:DUF3786 domain-containing protein n=1 Tax=Blautia stercoris TaxID=871664 RepID=UPI00355C4E0B
MDFDYAKDSKEQRPYEYYLKTYQEIDPKEISERTGFFYDEEKKVFTVVFMGSTYEISFPDYKISHKEDEKGVYPLEEAMNAKIFMVRYLSEKAKTLSSGKFLTYREVPWGEVYFRQFQGRCLMRLAFSYGNKLEAFKKVMTAIGAKPLEQGDCAFELEFMEGFFIRLILWEGDDEFPPSSQILFSDNFAVTFAAEDLAVAGDICINMMKAVERKLS